MNLLLEKSSEATIKRTQYMFFFAITIFAPLAHPFYLSARESLPSTLFMQSTFLAADINDNAIRSIARVWYW